MTKMADRKVISVIAAWLDCDYGASHCLAQQYSSRQLIRGTVMRYFFSLPGTIARLPQRIAGSPTMALAIFELGALLGVSTCQRGAACRAIALAAITRAADHHLAVAAGTVEQASIGQHRQKKPMRGWIVGMANATLVLCFGTWGTTSVFTGQSIWLALCPDLFGLTFIAHFFGHANPFAGVQLTRNNSSPRLTTR